MTKESMMVIEDTQAGLRAEVDENGVTRTIVYADRFSAPDGPMPFLDVGNFEEPTQYHFKADEYEVRESSQPGYFAVVKKGH